MRMRKFVVSLCLIMMVVVVHAVANDVLTVALNSPTGTLDPHALTSTDPVSIKYTIFEGLIKLDKSGDIQPSLATSWDVSESGTMYTFTLREGVVFHDNTEFDASVVAANFDRILNAEWDSSVKSYLVGAGLKSVEVLNKYKVALHTEGPSAPFLRILAVHSGLLASAKATDEHGQEYGGLDAALDGTGPFKVVKWVKGERIVLERFDDYWGTAPSFTGITFLVVPEAVTRSAMLEVGEVDVIFKVWPDEAKRLAEISGIDVDLFPTGRSMWVAINTMNPPLDDVRIRQALNYAINREDMVKKILLGSGVLADCVIAPQIFGYSPGTWDYPYDPEKARELLAEAGYPGGEGLKLTMQCANNHYVMENLIAQVVQADLKKIGVRVNLTISGDWPAHLGSWGTNPVDLLFMGWATSTMDADGALYQPFHPDRAGKFCNQSRYSNPAFAELMNAARKELQLEKRNALYKGALMLLNEDAPCLNLYYQGVYIGVKGVEGIWLDGAEHIVLLEAQRKR